MVLQDRFCSKCGEKYININWCKPCQIPETKDYIMAFENRFCSKCGKKYIDINWCKPCQIDDLKGNFTSWTSRNEKIDNFIQEMQLKINHPTNIVFEWIPYNQFSNIKVTGRCGFATVYSSVIWKDGPLKYNYEEEEYLRNLNYK